MDIVWGYHKMDYMYGSFLSILMSFLNVKVQNGDIFWGWLNLNYSFGVLEIPDISWG